MTAQQAKTPVGSAGVSVVIPCYNYARFLRAALDSALGQSHPHREIIVVDDGSTDDTPTVTTSYGDRIRCVRKANAGLSAARNTGIREASHPFIAFLDADDVWCPGHLEAVMAAFGRLGDSVGLVATKCDRIDAQGVPLARTQRDGAVHGALDVRDIVLRTCFPPSAAVVRRAAFDACGGFDETLTSSEDRDMWIRIGMHFGIHLLPDVLVHFRNHASSMSKNADRMKRNTGAVIRKARQAGVVPKTHLGFWLRVWAVNRFQCAWMYRDQGCHRQAIAEMAASVCLWPYFVRPDLLNEPVFFRARALRRFLWEAWHG